MGEESENRVRHQFLQVDFSALLCMPVWCVP